MTKTAKLLPCKHFYPHITTLYCKMLYFVWTIVHIKQQFKFPNMVCSEYKYGLQWIQISFAVNTNIVCSEYKYGLQWIQISFAVNTKLVVKYVLINYACKLILRCIAVSFNCSIVEITFNIAYLTCIDKVKVALSRLDLYNIRGGYCFTQAITQHINLPTHIRLLSKSKSLHFSDVLFLMCRRTGLLPWYD